MASSLLIGLTTAGLATNVFPKTALASDNLLESLVEKSLDQVTTEPSTLKETSELSAQPNVPNELVFPGEEGNHSTLAIPNPAPVDTDTDATIPLVSIDTPLVESTGTTLPVEQQPVTVFVPAATIRSVGSATVLEITPERQPLTLQSFTGDRRVAWKTQLRNDLIHPAITTGYQGVPAPPSSTLTVESGTMKVASANFDRNYLDTLLPAPTQSTANIRNGSIVYPFSRLVPITSPFGWRKHPIYGNTRLHAGIDFGASYGTPVLAILPGQVVAVGDAGGYGLRIILQHGDQTQTLYAHLSQTFVKVGEVIQAGQPIGKVGTSGNVTGPHLHLEFQQRTVDGWTAVNFRDQLNIAAANLRNGAHAIAAPAAQPADTDAPILRVAVGRRLHNVHLASSTPAWILDAQQRPIAVLPGMQSLVAVRTSRGIKVGTSTFPTVFFIHPSNNGAVAVGGKWYRGKLLVASLPNGLIVVNWVDIESYLYRAYLTSFIIGIRCSN